MKYYTYDEIKTKKLPPPAELDYVEFDFEDLTIRAYGILHGVTGAHNRDYNNLVTRTINTASGLIVGEKGMKLIYRKCHFDCEVDDWLVLRPSDSFFMGMQLMLDPRCLWMMTVDSLREYFTQKAPFPSEKNVDLQVAINESPNFHYLKPSLRRTIHGHISSEEAIRNDLRILSAPGITNILPRKRKLKLHHPIYKRMMVLERFMHIPARSLHMLHYAVGLAKTSDARLVSIFIGETHNTDMEFLSRKGAFLFKSLTKKEKEMYNTIQHRAERMSQGNTVSVKVTYYLLKFRYYLTLFLGACLPTTLYIWLLSFYF